MTPEKRIELEKQLNEQGLSILLTKDFDSILIQLARLAQFERICKDAVTLYPTLTGLLEYIQAQQSILPEDMPYVKLRPLETLDIPDILAGVNRSLHDLQDKQALIDPYAVEAASAAFVGILCRR